ncbi:hypothetical protein ACA910_011861 [Epithemia clementina (nom. ined.)]
MGRFAPQAYKADNLNMGINPFTCGFQNSERDWDVVIRTQNFDLMLQGHTQPTLAEQETFRTKDVPLPSTIYETGLQIKATSVILDVALGPMAPVCVALQTFCHTDWPHIEAHLNLTQEDHTPILPLILRWIQLELSVYLEDLKQGRPSTPPNFSQLERIITRQAFHQFSPMPSRYHATPSTAVPTNLPSTGSAPLAPTTPQATTSTAGAVSGSRDPGQRVDNPSPVATLQTAFANANVCIAQLRNHAKNYHQRCYKHHCSNLPELPPL